MFVFIHILAAAVLQEYTRIRVPDDHAIADLAMYNYVEVVYKLSSLSERQVLSHYGHMNSYSCNMQTHTHTQTKEHTNKQTDEHTLTHKHTHTNEDNFHNLRCLCKISPPW